MRAPGDSLQLRGLRAKHGGAAAEATAAAKAKAEAKAAKVEKVLEAKVEAAENKQEAMKDEAKKVKAKVEEKAEKAEKKGIKPKRSVRTGGGGSVKSLPYFDAIFVCSELGSHWRFSHAYARACMTLHSLQHIAVQKQRLRANSISHGVIICTRTHSLLLLLLTAKFPS